MGKGFSKQRCARVYVGSGNGGEAGRAAPMSKGTPRPQRTLICSGWRQLRRCKQTEEREGAEQRAPDAEFDDNIGCIVDQQLHKNATSCALCLRSIEENNALKVQLDAVGDICLPRKRRAPPGAASSDLTTSSPVQSSSDFSQTLSSASSLHFAGFTVHREHPHCARCDFTFFCNFCDEILNKIEAELVQVAGCVAMKHGRRRRHPFCPHCCPESQARALRELRALSQRCGWSDDSDIADDWDMCAVAAEEDDEDEIALGGPVGARGCGPAPPKHIKIANVRDLVAAVERDSGSAPSWFVLGRSIFPTQKVVVGGRSVDKIDCLAAAVERRPNSTQYMSELLLHCPHNRAVNLNGVQHGVVDLAVRVVELNPTSSTAWRNLGLLMPSCSHADLMGESMSRAAVLHRSSQFATTENDIFAAAYALGADPGTIVFDGRDASRLEVLASFMDSIPEEVGLLEAVHAMLGDAFATQVVCELSLTFPNHPRITDFAKNYILDRERTIGKGGFGTVYEAHHVNPASGRKTRLAAKTVAYDAAMPSINREQEMMLTTCYRFQNYITRCFFIRFDPIAATATLFLECASGGSLADVLAARGHRLHERELRSMMQQLLEGITMLHTYSIVHQDIKPGNVLCFDDGQVKLADFGISSNLCCKGSGPSSGSLIAGTEQYMPPEALNGRVVCSAWDVWSLGVMMVELATGGVLVPDPAVLADPDAEPPFPPAIPQHLSRHLRALLHRCLDPNHATRITAREALDDAYFQPALHIAPELEPDATYEASKWDPGVDCDRGDGSGGGPASSAAGLTETRHHGMAARATTTTTTTTTTTIMGLS